LAFEAFYQMVSKDSRLSKLAKKRRTDVYFAESNSSAMPVAFSEKKTDGLNPSFVSLDELASWRGDAGLKQYEVFKSALGARSQPLMFGISTAGYENDSIYDELIKRSTALLNGTSQETRLAPFLYIIDDQTKWNDINELKKSNPNLGVSTSVDYLLEEIRIAEGSLSKKVEFLTKYCNVKQNSSLAWLTSDEVRGCFGNNLRLEDFRHTYALGGIDLSMTTDLTAAVAVIEKDGVSYFFTQFFLPKEKIKDATARDGLPYEAYIQRGFLTPSGDKVVDYNDVYNWFLMLQRKYEIYMIKVGYDRYSAQYLVDQMQASGFVMESVSQGSNLTGVLIDMEGMIRDRKLVCANDNDLMKIHMLDAALKMEQGTNRRRMVKITAKAHIDGMAALSDAICMRHNHWASFPQLQNRR
jgi:phage terminase large subunit-like protein